MGSPTSEEIGRMLVVLAPIILGVAGIVTFVIWVIKQLVTRKEFNDLKLKVDELVVVISQKEHVPPQVEYQLQKMVEELKKLNDAINSPNRRKNG